MSAGHKIPKDHPAHSFFANRDPSVEVYVSHVDATSVSTRKRHFLLLAGMNLVFSFLLTRRLYRGLSRYGVWFVVGQLVPQWSVPAPGFNRTLLGNIFLDLFIFMVLVPIFLDFIRGAAALRWYHGFPPEEIVFRKPGDSTIANVVSEAPEKRDAMMKDLLRRAIDPEEMKHPMFGLPWEEWTYDYKAMAEACELDKKGVIDAKTWELCVWMKMQDGWAAIEQGKEADMYNQAGMMEKMRARLQKMGKLSVFNQMMEVIQVKTMSKDGTPLPVTEEVDAIIADIFKRNDVDFVRLTSELAKDASLSARFSKSSKKRD